MAVAAGFVLAVLLGASCNTMVVNFTSPPPPTVSGPSHYVQFTCCKISDLTSCLDDMLGDAATCNDAGTWKMNATVECEAQGLRLGDYWLKEACAPDAGAN